MSYIDTPKIYERSKSLTKSGTFSRNATMPSQGIANRFKEGLTANMPSTPEEGEANTSPPSRTNGDQAERMERGESTGPSGHPHASSSATVAEPDTIESTQHPGETNEIKHKRSTSSAKGWRFRQEIPRSDSRGGIHTYDEGGVRVEEGADGRIHVIHDPPS